MPSRKPVLEFRKAGIYCPAGAFYIDPWLPVSRAVITHAHSDHARPGMGSYLATRQTAAALRVRLGAAIPVTECSWGEVIHAGQAKVSFHPSGHLPGAAQIRVEVNGEIWVASGDYKTEDDGISLPFEPVRCHTFISECTFGLPVFDWKPQKAEEEQIRSWLQDLADAGKHGVLQAYSLGKAQRLLSMLGGSEMPVRVHPGIATLNRALEAAGVVLPAWQEIAPDEKNLPPGSLVIVPPMAASERYLSRLGPHESAFCSGWMAIRGFRNRAGADRGFVLSDHADWKGLLRAVRETGAETIWATHGYTDVFARYLREQYQLDARAAQTRFLGAETPGQTDETLPT